MLLCEWQAWWRVLPAIDADERLGLYAAVQLGTPGWDIPNRAGIVHAWQQAAEAASPARGLPDADADQQAPGGVRRAVEAVQRWLQQHFGHGIE